MRLLSDWPSLRCIDRDLAPAEGLDYNRAVPRPELPPLVLAAITRLRAALEERFGGRLREFVLFGSHAREQAQEDSDVDLLVVVDALTEGERREVFDLAWQAGADGDEYVSLAPLPYSAAQATERLLMREIARDGVNP
jgi:hypothetical protein